jgi:hypothetical protein
LIGREGAVMSLREITRTQFQRLAVSVIPSLPATSTDVAWFAAADESLIGVVLHDSSTSDWQYIIYRRQWGICSQVAQAVGYPSRPDAALRMHMQELALAWDDGQTDAPAVW